jgi:hypothetical protein
VEIVAPSTPRRSLMPVTGAFAHSRNEMAVAALAATTARVRAHAAASTPPASSSAPPAKIRPSHSSNPNSSMVRTGRSRNETSMRCSASGGGSDHAPVKNGQKGVP